MNRRSWVLAALAVFLAVGLFGVGVVLGQRLVFRSFSVQLRGIQATLLFDRIAQERGIRSLLARGCVPEAIGELSNNELADRKTLADFVHAKLDAVTLAYIDKRDPKILNELESPAGSFTNTWPGCQK